VNQAGDLPLGGERDLDLGAWAYERISVDDEAVTDMGVEQRSALFLLDTIVADGDRCELRVPDYRRAETGVRPALSRAEAADLNARSSANGTSRSSAA
jgi:hypothetical protein